MSSALAATLWGGLAASSLVIGGALALRFRLPVRLVGLILAFGAGTLISAVAYELVPDVTVDAAGVAIAMGAGAIVFYLGNSVVSKMGGAQPQGSQPGRGRTRPPAPAARSSWARSSTASPSRSCSASASRSAAR